MTQERMGAAAGIRPSGALALRTRSNTGWINSGTVLCAAPASAIRTTDTRSCGQYLRPYDARRRSRPHTATRRRCSAESTSGTVTSAMPPGAETTSPAVRHGPQICGSLGPKITTEGSPKAAAMWAGPESLPTNNNAEASRAFKSEAERALRGGKAAECVQAVTRTADEERRNSRFRKVLSDCEEVGGRPGFFGRRGHCVNDGGPARAARGARGPGGRGAWARGISTAGAPRKNMALARCSAVWTFRSTCRISWARGMRTL